MTVSLDWQEIVLRIAASVLAGGLIGYDRGTRGRIAGLRTTILICLAASAAMIEANLTLSVTGKSPQSFAVMDALRFPLGILSGIGFIGAGAILRRGSLVTGITTAATLWLMTVVGLIFGAGYFFLGTLVTAIAFVVLTALRKVEPLLRREHRASLIVKISGASPSNRELRAMISREGLEFVSFGIEYEEGITLTAVVSWRSAAPYSEPPQLVEQLAKLPGVTRVTWQPSEAGHLSD